MDGSISKCILYSIYDGGSQHVGEVNVYVVNGTHFGANCTHFGYWKLPNAETFPWKRFQWAEKYRYHINTRTICTLTPLQCILHINSCYSMIINNNTFERLYLLIVFFFNSSHSAQPNNTQKETFHII